MNLRGRKGWFRIWIVASVVWLVVAVGYIYIQHEQWVQCVQEHAAIFEGPFPPSVEWLDGQCPPLNVAKNVLLVIVPPLVFPALILLIMAVGRWIRHGFEAT